MDRFWKKNRWRKRGQLFIDVLFGDLVRSIRRRCRMWEVTTGEIISVGLSCNPILMCFVRRKED
jgi:hypothetical protein